MKKLRSYIILFIIVLIVAVVGLFIILLSKDIMTKDPKNMVLSLTDINQKDIPPGLVFNTSLSVEFYKNGSYWANESQEQVAMDQGFINGYYEYFFYQNPSLTNNIKTIGSSIVLFNQSQISREIIDNETQFYLSSDNCTSFNFPNIGDGSFGCYNTVNRTLPGVIVAVSYYNIFFYKNNAAIRVWVGQTGTVNLSNEAIQY